MRLSELKIQHFRAFKDETICFDKYTCLVGANGCGKSTILAALNIFFRNTQSSTTNITLLSDEDFHMKDTTKEIRITLTFEDISDEASEDLKHYVRQKKLIVVARANWDESKHGAPVEQLGSRLVMAQFAEFFKAQTSGERVDALKKIYVGLREQFAELPAPGSKDAMGAALRDYEEGHPELCQLKESTEQFYGVTKGESRLGKYIQWIYIPAVKDASDEQNEGRTTALGELLQRTIRSKVSFDEPIAALREELGTKYQELLAKEQNSLTSLSDSLQERLRQWSNPNTNLQLAWNYDPNKSVQVTEPAARIKAGEGKFLGDLARLGHGLQRAFIVTVLHELAMVDQSKAPTLLLGVEEPELYQHPPQARHMAGVLEDLGQGNCQVIVATHSPYFVSGQGFESVRMVRKTRPENNARVTSVSYESLSKTLADALGEAPEPATSLMCRIEQIMQPSQNEMFFTTIPIFVEGLEDIAFISAHLHLNGQWNAFRKAGCHFIIAGGKSNMSRLIAIASGLGNPFFAVFDADGNETKADARADHQRDNLCLLHLCGLNDGAAFPSETLWHQNLVVWPTKIGDMVKQDIGPEAWQSAETTARKDKGLETARAKTTSVITATLERLWTDKKKSEQLSKLCDSVIHFAESCRN